MKLYVWTEAFNCGEILSPMLKSYTTHHNREIHVWGFENDIAAIDFSHPLVLFHAIKIKPGFVNFLQLGRRLKRAYKKGHRGTAVFWSYLIRKFPRHFLVHLDSDQVFLADCLEPISEAADLGFSAAGSRRPYRYRTYRLEGRSARRLNGHPDTLNTDCFGFNSADIKNRNSPLLVRRIQGKRPLRYPVIDFFDPITLEMHYMNFRIKFIDSESEGLQGKQNKSHTFIANRISFAAVGSGLNFLKNPLTKTSPGYRSFAVSSYSLFAYYLLNKDTGLEMLQDREIKEKLDKLDRSSWTLKSKKS